MAGGVASSLIELTQNGCGPQAIARAIDLLAAAADTPPLEEAVHLVATGPDEVGGAPRATGVVVSDLFRGAEKSVIVVGYAVHQGQKVFRDLADRMAQHPGLQVRLCLDIQRKRRRHVEKRSHSLGKTRSMILSSPHQHISRWAIEKRPSSFWKGDIGITPQEWSLSLPLLSLILTAPIHGSKTSCIV